MLSVCASVQLGRQCWIGELERRVVGLELTNRETVEANIAF